MKKQFIIILILCIGSLLTINTFAQTTCVVDPACPATRLTDANIVLRTLSGGSVTQILPNTQYLLRITQPANTSTNRNVYWQVCAGGGFGYVQSTTSIGNDGLAGQTTSATITSDSFGGIIVVDVSAGGSNSSGLCLTQATRDFFPE